MLRDLKRPMSPYVTCPNCRGRIAWSSDNPYRPFCSQRCRQVDLGEWFNEAHHIPGPELPPGFDDADNDPDHGPQ